MSFSPGVLILHVQLTQLHQVGPSHFQNFVVSASTFVRIGLWSMVCDSLPICCLFYFTHLTSTSTLARLDMLSMSIRIDCWLKDPLQMIVQPTLDPQDCTRHYNRISQANLISNLAFRDYFATLYQFEISQQFIYKREMGTNLEKCSKPTTSVTEIMGGSTFMGKWDPKLHWLKIKSNFPQRQCGTYIDPPPNDCWYQCYSCYSATLRKLQVKCACEEGLKFSLNVPDPEDKKICNECRSDVKNDPRGYLYCNKCNYDKCYSCIEKQIKNIDYKQLAVEIGAFVGKQGIKSGASSVVNKTVQKAVGGIVPGVGAAVLMHFNTIYAASQGDEKGVIKGVTGGFGGLSGAVIGQAFIPIPGIGALIGGIVGSGVGWLAGYGACKLLD